MNETSVAQEPSGIRFGGFSLGAMGVIGACSAPGLVWLLSFVFYAPGAKENPFIWALYYGAWALIPGMIAMAVLGVIAARRRSKPLLIAAFIVPAAFAAYFLIVWVLLQQRCGTGLACQRDKPTLIIGR